MYRQSFGSTRQVQFTNEHEYYRLLGYLAKSDGSTEITWEHNEEQGAWGSEGRIKFRKPKPDNIGTLKLTAGVGNVLYRVNCNSFVKNLYKDHHYVQGIQQNIQEIQATIPPQYIADFNDGLIL